MKNAYRTILFLGLAIFLSSTVNAQVKLKLSLLADQKTYVVSMVPEDSWEWPMNMVGSSQIVLQMEAGRHFQAGQITSLLPGVSWIDNAYIDSPASAPDYNFVCFALKELGTKKIPFTAGVETPLFSFVNLEPDCVGKVSLVENDNPLVKRIIRNDRVNITQNMTVLGAKGNAYSGNVQGIVNCRTVTPARKDKPVFYGLHVFPVPATDVLQISWKNDVGQEVNKILIHDLSGQQMRLEKIIPEAGERRVSLDVTAFPTGLYTANLINVKGERQSFQFIVARP